MKITDHPAPSVPGVVCGALLDNLYDVELVVVMADVCLVQHAVKLSMHLEIDTIQVSH